MYICTYTVCVFYLRTYVQVVGKNDRVLVFSDGSFLSMMAVNIGAGKVCCSLLLLLLLLWISLCVCFIVGVFFIFVYLNIMDIIKLHNGLYSIYCVSIMIQKDNAKCSQISYLLYFIPSLPSSTLCRSTPQRCLVYSAEFSERYVREL